MLDLVVSFDRIDVQKPLTLQIEADVDTCLVLAERFGWLNIDGIKGEVTLSRLAGQACYMKGTIKADITQSCVVTDEPVRQHLSIFVDERFAIMDTPKDEELIDPMSVQTEPMIGRNIPVGETIAQLIALEAPEWPRVDSVSSVEMKDADFEESGPFGKLAELKKTR
jgi:uncharacterized metal-binding protein YceD (DUF177 family)